MNTFINVSPSSTPNIGGDKGKEPTTTSNTGQMAQLELTSAIQCDSTSSNPTTCNLFEPHIALAETTLTNGQHLSTDMAAIVAREVQAQIAQMRQLN